MNILSEDTNNNNNEGIHSTYVHWNGKRKMVDEM